MPRFSSGSVSASASRISWSRALRRPGLEIVSRATASAGRSRRSLPPASRSSTPASYSRTTRTSPSLTLWPSSQRISFTTPSSSDSTGISIFIDSRITTVSPSETSSPTATSIFQTVPVMWASTSGNESSCAVRGERVAGTIPAAMSARPPVVLIAARNEAERLPATLRALAAAFPGARIVVGDDGSTDDTARLARAAGAEVVSAPRPLGKGGAATLAARAVLDATTAPDPPLVLLCDADLGDSAARLAPLLDAVEAGAADVAVAVFARRVGGGFGLAVGAARRAIERATGLQL